AAPLLGNLQQRAQRRPAVLAVEERLSAVQDLLRRENAAPVEVAVEGPERVDHLDRLGREGIDDEQAAAGLALNRLVVELAADPPSQAVQVLGGLAGDP